MAVYPSARREPHWFATLTPITPRSRSAPTCIQRDGVGGELVQLVLAKSQLEFAAMLSCLLERILSPPSFDASGADCYRSATPKQDKTGMAGFLCGLITGLICTGLGIYLTWLSGKADRAKARALAEAQIRIAQLEEEKNKWQLLERFTPRLSVRGIPTNGQFITVTDSVSFRVIKVDYLTANGIEVTSQAVDRSGMDVQIPIDEFKATEVQKQGCDPEDGSFSMSFRIHAEVDGMTKICILPVRVAVNSAVKLEPMPLGMATAEELACKTTTDPDGQAARR